MTEKMEMLYLQCAAGFNDRIAPTDGMQMAIPRLLAALSEEQQKPPDNYLEPRAERQESISRHCFLGGMNCLMRLLPEAPAGP